MGEAKLNIKLLDVTKDPLSLIYAACRQCYSPKFAGDILEEKNRNPGKAGEFVKQIVKSGHESPLEHVKFTFAAEGVSRALTHQLVRHRVASYSQQSQRYVKETNLDYIIPPSIKEDEEMKKEFLRTVSDIQKSYDKLIEKFKEKNITGEKANQDARYVLPQAAETKIVITMNCRELLHFFKQRCCARAQWEIKALADKMLEACKAVLPAVFENAGAKCVSLNYCPEGEKFTCGKYQVKQERRTSA
jgi:thymidylate synthase (FAD)